MKRFLVLFISIAYSVVGCAGSNKWTKPSFDPDEFGKDREECIRSIDKNLVSDAFGKALEECLAEKGYKYDETKHKPQPQYTTAERILFVALIGIAYVGIGLAAMAAGAGGLGH